MSDDGIPEYPEYEDWDLVTPGGQVVARMRGDIMTGDPLAMEYLDSIVILGLRLGVGYTQKVTPRQVDLLRFTLAGPAFCGLIEEEPTPDEWTRLEARRADGRPIKLTEVRTYFGDVISREETPT